MATPSDIGKQLVTQTPVVAGGLLRSIVDFAIDGNSSFPGAKAAAAKALEAKTDREQAIDSLVVQHVGVASAQGFVTSVGGLLTLPVGLPANILAAPLVAPVTIAILPSSLPMLLSPLPEGNDTPPPTRRSI